MPLNNRSYLLGCESQICPYLTYKARHALLGEYLARQHLHMDKWTLHFKLDKYSSHY